MCRIEVPELPWRSRKAQSELPDCIAKNLHSIGVQVNCFLRRQLGQDSRIAKCWATMCHVFISPLQPKLPVSVAVDRTSYNAHCRQSMADGLMLRPSDSMLRRSKRTSREPNLSRLLVHYYGCSSAITSTRTYNHSHEKLVVGQVPSNLVRARGAFPLGLSANFGSLVPCTKYGPSTIASLWLESSGKAISKQYG